MIIHDPIYGAFEAPQFLDPLILAPEVRRLMNIRLLNAPSPSLPTLSEIRRFSHTLGVLRLSLLNPHVGLTKDELRALSAAILIHDAATPPFAHLLEYYLNDRSGWDHETALPGLLTGHQFTTNIAHQIIPGETMKFRKLCNKAKIDFDIVLAITQKRHPASRLLFGSLDFDNLDNVLRMAWALGLDPEKSHFLQIARSLAVSITGDALLSNELTPEVSTWAEARRSAYQILVFDGPTVALQAVITKAIKLLFQDTDLTDIKWSDSDEDLISLLLQSSKTKEFMIRNFNSLPTLVLSLQIPGTLSTLGLASREEAISLIENIAREKFGVPHPIGYALIDKGSFSKRLNFIDPATRNSWEVGETSQSLIFYCFAHESKRRIAGLSKSLRDTLEQVIHAKANNASSIKKHARPQR